MTIEEIMEMWGEDSHIDDKDLDNESLKEPISDNPLFLLVRSISSPLSAMIRRLQRSVSLIRILKFVYCVRAPGRFYK